VEEVRLPTPDAPTFMPSALLAAALSTCGCSAAEENGQVALGAGAPHACVLELPGPPLGSGRPIVLAYDRVSSDMTAEAWAPLTARVERATGLRIELQEHARYADTVAAISGGQADLALLPPLAYVRARETTPGIEPLAQTLVDGMTSYSAYFFVRRDSPWTTATDLRGQRVAFVDELSTSGFLFPYAALLDVGVDPEHDLGEMVFTGDHVASLRALAEGRVTAAASFSDALEWAQPRSVQEGWALPDLRVLLHAGRLPLDVLCAGASLGEPLREQLREVLLATNTTEPAGRAFYASSGRIVGWAPASDALFDPVRRVRRRVAEHRQEAGTTPPETAP
jgi:phosphonate transport system substrate-binding protein